MSRINLNINKMAEAVQSHISDHRQDWEVRADSLRSETMRLRESMEEVFPVDQLPDRLKFEIIKFQLDNRFRFLAQNVGLGDHIDQMKEMFAAVEPALDKNFSPTHANYSLEEIKQITNAAIYGFFPKSSNAVS
jgi:hypothetical protein